MRDWPPPRGGQIGKLVATTSLGFTRPPPARARAPSHVTWRARSSAARPIRFAARRFDHSSSIAAASASGVGSATRPVLPWLTSSAVPPESVAVMTGLPARIASSVTSPKSSSCGTNATARAPA